VLACNVLGNLVREAMPPSERGGGGGGNISQPAPHEVLAKLGALEVLQGHAQQPNSNSQVRFPGLLPCDHMKVLQSIFTLVIGPT